ncbi:MAG: Crp/Fnr family transcriptional regulator [Phenylobacterium sp.]|nr:Crp/Fnr family transcriptional regulator [Phenylobacterium sp.]
MLSGRLQPTRVAQAKGTALFALRQPPAMPKSNALLARLEPECFAQVERRLKPLQLERGDVVQRPGEDVQDVLFPLDAVLALGSETIDGESVNVTLLGREGALCVFEACGSRRSYTRAVVQVPGRALTLTASAYRDLFSQSANLRRSIHMYVEVLLAEGRQSTACNALHSVENRLARILLDMRDKARRDHLPVTQEALAQLLGVQRTTIAASVSALQKRRVIKSGRGVEVLDAEGLADAACSCRDTLAFLSADIQSVAETVCEAEVVARG